MSHAPLMQLLLTMKKLTMSMTTMMMLVLLMQEEAVAGRQGSAAAAAAARGQMHDRNRQRKRNWRLLHLRRPVAAAAVQRPRHLGRRDLHPRARAAAAGPRPTP